MPDVLKEIDQHVLDCDNLKRIITRKQSSSILRQLEKQANAANVELVETDLDYLISKKSFKEINKIYKESELENDNNR